MTYKIIAGGLVIMIIAIIASNLYAIHIGAIHIRGGHTYLRATDPKGFWRTISVHTLFAALFALASYKAFRAGQRPPNLCPPIQGDGALDSGCRGWRSSCRQAAARLAATKKSMKARTAGRICRRLGW